MKLGLGTVQFGLKYGINNTGDKTSIQQIEKILQRARNASINLLDTAADYGDSEDTIGSLVGDDSHFSIVTKLSQKMGTDESVKNSFYKLKRTHLYGLLIHDFQQYASNPKIWEEMIFLRNRGYINKVGFSLYLPQQLDFLEAQGISFDLIQIPYSILDQRFEPYLKGLKSRGIEIHVRSVFVQGLVFQKTEKLHSFFNPIKEKLQKLELLSERSGRSIQSLCLNFAYSNSEIDKIIIGVDSDENLQHNLEVVDQQLTPDEMEVLRSLKEQNEEMILPYKWNYK